MADYERRSPEKFVEIYFSYNDCETDLIGCLLKQEGIPYILRDQRISPYPMTINCFGERRFAVPESEVGRARDLIHDAIAAGAIIGDGKFKEIKKKRG
ncbi:MAG: hypothetical protein JW984_01125 [Deltaproteobacteria bacterium]|uniref:DUF2007 domain-containing protein n=1 Tax=Candidatus Zymogenus saltonus TaxID=2844893 RepID=A0A9D8PNE6_9DELT|nr:hypothetical protein [Candidatus Zymogenus saltonus]